MSQKNNLQELPQKKRICLKNHQIVELLVLLGLVVLLILYLLFRSAASFSYQLPKFEKLNSADIQSIRWSRADGSERNLRKDGENWYIGEQKYPAKQSYVQTLLEQLSNPSLQDLVSKSGNMVTFGLDDQRAYHLEAFAAEGSEPLRQFYVGKASSSGRYSFVRLSAEDARVFTLAENLSATLEKSIDDLRDRLVLSFNSSDIEKLQITETATGIVISVEKTDDKWQIPEGSTWTENQVNSLVNRFASMNAQSFIAEYPESDNTYELKFIAKGGVSYTISIAAQAIGTDGNKGYAAKSSSYGFPFTLNNYTVESMLKDFGFIKEDANDKGSTP